MKENKTKHTLKFTKNHNRIILIGIGLLLISLLLSSNIASLQAATTTYTFGNTAIGPIINGFGNDRDASRYQLTQNGIVQSVTVYFKSGGTNAKAAIYADNNGAPGALLTQSSSQSVASNSWTTFAVPQVSLSAGYYWLAMVSSGSTAGAMTSTSSNSHAWKSTTYSSEFPSSFGTPNGYEKTATSIYATYTLTSSPTPTSTPTPTPSPAPTYANNLEPIPTGWSRATNGMWLSVGGVSNVKLDTANTFNGNPSIRIDPVWTSGNSGREANGKPLNIKPGDHVVFKVWIKTSAPAAWEGDRGARIGIDFYGPNGRIIGVNTPDGQTWTPWNQWPRNENLNFVSWGNSNWKQIVMDFWVPNSFVADYWSAYPTGTYVTPTSLIPWMQVCSTVDGGQAWFANAEFYINP